MNTYAMEQITRERIADWHREAQNERQVRPRQVLRPRFLSAGTIARSVANAGVARLVSLRRFAARFAAAT